MASRPVSQWFGFDYGADYNVQVDGSPIDRNISLILIAAAVFVLARYRLDRLRGFFRNNAPLVVFFAYLALSILWADSSFVAFKRWFRDVANILMALIILTEDEPANAIKDLFLKVTYFLVPLSITLIKYYPDLGRYFNPWSWTYNYGGVTTNKNTLGLTLFFGVLAVVIASVDWWRSRRERGARPVFLMLTSLTVMIAWLFHMAQSSTAVACAFIGVGIIFLSFYAWFRRCVRRFGIAAVCLFAIAIVADQTFGISSMIYDALGRNETLSGRVDIWQRVLQVPIDPWFGTGYYSFWMNPGRVQYASSGLYFSLNEAHNGYIETYLDSGIVGLCLLGLLLFSCLKRASSRLQFDIEGGSLMLALALATFLYNYTESAFNRLDLIWFGFIVAAIRLPYSWQVVEPEPYWEQESVDWPVPALELQPDEQLTPKGYTSF